MPFRVIVFLIICMSAGIAQAGAWPRDKGAGFASVAIRLGWPQNLGHWISDQPTDDYRTAYLEYGLTDKIVIGFDVGNSVSGQSKAIAFVQYRCAILTTSQHSSAIGVWPNFRRARVTARYCCRLGAKKKGWFSVESFVEMRADPGEFDYKVDLTWGHSLTKDRKLILQLQTGAQAGDPVFARIAPSVVFPVTKRIMAETGATYGLHSDTSMGLKFGLWTDF